MIITKYPHALAFLTTILSILMIGGAVSAQTMNNPKTRDLMSDTWDATDALGRTLPGYKECGPPRPDKYVGIFYFLWETGKDSPLYDISKLLKADSSNPQYGPLYAFHWWGEPYLGYYLSDDPFVIRKHAQMLANAGVDVLIFDVTNALTYDPEYMEVCKVLESMRAVGEKTPQITFITHSKSAEVVQHLYDVFYSKNLYPDLWFRWKGKPLIISSEEGLDQKIRDFFTFRESWAWSKGQQWFGDGKDKWPWIDNYPQNYGWDTSPDKPEEISVCVAQHPVSNIGRSFHDSHEPPPSEQTPALGLCFAEQWKRALQVDPEFVFVTGWNEWIAQRFVNNGGISFLGKPLPKGGTYFVDEYDEEYSRDIEPMRGGFGDNYYYQLVANIRRYKGVRQVPAPSPQRTIIIGNHFSQWDTVKPVYFDDIGDTVHRDHAGWGGKHYVNDSGRNDFDTMKVARDRLNLYFYVRTVEPITPPKGDKWMLLFINTDDNPKTGWEGYDYVINRGGPGVIEKNVADKWEWKPIGHVRYAIKGNQMQIAVPRSLIGLPESAGKLRFDFKWADNAPVNGDILSFIDQGDTAPDDRFSYRYEER
jgi:hypothetical protein